MKHASSGTRRHGLAVLGGDLGEMLGSGQREWKITTVQTLCYCNEWTVPNSQTLKEGG